MKYLTVFLFFVFLINTAYCASITVVPDADSVTNSWTSTPLFSKIDDDIDSPDGTIITSPLDPGAADTINFSLTEILEGQVDQVNIRIRARQSLGIGTVSLNISWFMEDGSLIASTDTGALTGSLADYASGALSVSINRTHANTSILSVIPATSGGALNTIEIDAVNLDLTTSNTSLRANATIPHPSYFFTGESTIINGSCEANGLTAAENVQVILQNSTDNVTFTRMTTSPSEPIFSNTSNYSIGFLANANSSALPFIINVTKPGNYTLRIQCNATNTNPREANTTGANLTVNQTYGYLNVTLLRPLPTVVTSDVAQNMNFTIIANVTCSSSNPTAVCDMVNGTVRYNYTSALPDTQINTTQGDVPFWTQGNKTCGFMNYSNVCSLNWTVNATGEIGRSYKVDVLFSSNATIAQNDTADVNVTITACIVDFTLQWQAITFGAQVPDTTQNAAQGNAGNEYNISINPGSCNTDIYIRGNTNLTNNSYANTIGIGNVTWSNVSNTYSTSVNLTYSYVPVMLDVPAVTNVTTWYWINVPPVFYGIYNGTISIGGVKNGEGI